jgi:glutamyl-tRNA(Gln) amidotransferase subunit E
MMAKKEEDRDSAHYKEIGFMCGLEIHQRLATKEKLFCSCIATIANGENNIIGTVSRYQRAVAGELGNIDRSAEFEELRNRKFTYKIHDSHTCLVEIDEEPPHPLNQEALGIALSLASAMNMRIIDELQPMRKEVVDGSDPSAFQRTVFVAADGKIKVEGISVNIPSIFLEEESSGIISTSEDGITYDTDRLGIPLVEIDTDPYIPTPKAARAIALYIGTLLRISGRVQRGIGSIRQDVNVSIKGGARVEIKGLQEVDKIDRFVENEIARQQKLLEIAALLKKLKAHVGNSVDATEIFKKSSVKVIANHLEKNGVAFAFGLFGFKGVLGIEINPNRRLGTEMSEYAKMAKVNGLIHSDENLDAYGFAEKERRELAKLLGLGEKDAFVVIAGNKNDVKRAAELAIERAKYALVGVPLETRGTYNTELCTTKFLRPLPGGSRMYPETDAKPIIITKEHMSAAVKNAPNIEKERKELASKLDNKDIVEQLLLSPRLQLYKNIIGSTKADPAFIANTIIQKFTELRREGFDVEGIEEQRLADLFVAYSKNEITKQAVEELLKEMSLRKESVDDLITVKRLKRIRGKELQEIVTKSMNEIRDPNDMNELRSVLMSKYRLNVDGSELNELLAKKKSR